MTKEEKAKKDLIIALNEIKDDLYYDDNERAIDTAMTAIVEKVASYEEETGDLSLREATSKYYTPNEVKDDILQLFDVDGQPLKNALWKIRAALFHIGYKNPWYKKVDQQYYALANTDVNGLIRSLIRIADKSRLDKEKQKLIDYLAGLDFTDTVDVEGDYFNIVSQCLTYAHDTEDYFPRDFCEDWFVSPYSVREAISKTLTHETSCPEDLLKIKQMIKDCTFEKKRYQKFADNTYSDISVEGLEWLRENLIKILKEGK